MDSIHTIIKSIRAEKGLTQKEMAVKLQMVPSAYGKIETGNARLTIERLREIANIFNLPITHFLK